MGIWSYGGFRPGEFMSTRSMTAFTVGRTTADEHSIVGMHRSIWIECPLQHVFNSVRPVTGLLAWQEISCRRGREYVRLPAARLGVSFSPPPPIVVTKMNATLAWRRGQWRLPPIQRRRRRRCCFFGNHWSTQWTMGYHRVGRNILSAAYSTTCKVISTQYFQHIC